MAAKYESNSIPMMNWSGCSTFLMRSLKIAALFFFLCTIRLEAQNFSRLNTGLAPALNTQNNYNATKLADTTYASPEYPDPKNVLYKSLMIPGWGQIVNNQIWKVPIVYALIGGVTGYSIYLNKRYHDYRAAYYNLNPQQEGTDERFGSTPAYLQNANPSALRSTRNSLRNRRDSMYIAILLAYGLNAIDAYVFAHLRSFDVSEDLSMRPSIKPNILAHSTPGLTLSLELFSK